jgi:serine O-acetyltransferase
MQPMTWNKTRRLIRADVYRRLELEGRRPCLSNFVKALFVPAVIAVVIPRVVSFLFRNGWMVTQKLLGLVSIVLFNVEIDPRAEIEGGLVIANPMGILVHRRTAFGKNCTLHHHTTFSIGPRRRMDPERDLVRLEDSVVVGPGARLMGNFRIGRGSRIEPNAVVMYAAEPGEVLRGMPARNVAEQPSENAPNEPGRPASRPRRRKVTLRETLRLIHSDVLYRAAIDGKPFSWFYYVKLILNPPALAVVSHRVQHWLDRKGLSVPAWLLHHLSLVLFSVDIDPKAEIGEALVLAHANGVVIGKNVRIGKRCILIHQNTLAVGMIGDEVKSGDELVLGDDVIVGAGARVVGSLTIGDRCNIGINASVTRSAPPYAFLFGVPAEIVAVGKPSPATAPSSA